MRVSLWSFISISLVVIVTPGPDTLMTVRSTLLSSVKQSGWQHRPRRHAARV
jgi:threonine/homoserine/homoserine lactone efflux protein